MYEIIVVAASTTARDVPVVVALSSVSEVVVVVLVVVVLIPLLVMELYFPGHSESKQEIYTRYSQQKLNVFTKGLGRTKSHCSLLIIERNNNQYNKNDKK